MKRNLSVKKQKVNKNQLKSEPYKNSVAYRILLAEIWYKIVYAKDNRRKKKIKEILNINRLILNKLLTFQSSSAIIMKIA